MWDKDVRISQKKVDESWKEQAERDKTRLSPASQQPQASTRKEVPTSPALMKFLNSLVYQVLYHLGELPGGGAQEEEVNVEAAREIMDIISTLKIKMEGNLSQEETAFFSAVLPELEMKLRQFS